MKKIGLLLILLCVSALNGMESTEPKSIIYNLLPEVRGTIIAQALESSENVDDAINAIKALSLAHGISPDTLFTDIKVFTKLVHMLADKFNESTGDVASKFNPSTAKQYTTLALQLFAAVSDNDLVKTTNLINQGADVNYPGFKTPLGFALSAPDAKNSIAMTQLLLNAGANPNLAKKGISIVDFMQQAGTGKEVQQLILDAIEKQKKKQE